MVTVNQRVLQVRLELTTSASLCRLLSYKYRALTDCATGACSGESVNTGKNIWTHVILESLVDHTGPASPPLNVLSTSTGCSPSIRKPRPTSPTGLTWVQALLPWRPTERRSWAESLRVWPRLTTWPTACWSSASSTPSSWEWTRPTSRWDGVHWHHVGRDTRRAEITL